MKVEIAPVEVSEIVVRLSRTEARQLHNELYAAALRSHASVTVIGALVSALTNAKIQID